jgi:hypothetical protein
MFKKVMRTCVVMLAEPPEQRLARRLMATRPLRDERLIRDCLAVLNALLSNPRTAWEDRRLLSARD